MGLVVLVVGAIPLETQQQLQGTAATLVHLTASQALGAINDGMRFDFIVWSSPLDRASFHQLVHLIDHSDSGASPSRSAGRQMIAAEQVAGPPEVGSGVADDK
jgi:hypothetical protein